MKRYYLLFFSLLTFGAFAQSPRVLIVTAHPDDETMFPVTIFKITHELKGSADLALITDASGGYNGLVASSYYGMNLVDSVVGRKHLPLIRKKELMASGEILGIGNFFFLDQLDDYYNRDEKPYLQGKNWDISYVERRLDQILAKGNYDFVSASYPAKGSTRITKPRPSALYVRYSVSKERKNRSFWADNHKAKAILSNLRSSKVTLKLRFLPMPRSLSLTAPMVLARTKSTAT
jgi:hypothetical protein